MTHEEPAISFDLHSNFRCYLDPSWGDEVDDQFEHARYRKIRERGVVLWTTFEFDVKKKVASTWMPEELVVNLKSRDWECGMYRTDIWQPAFKIPEDMVEVVEKGERWVDWKDGDHDGIESELMGLALD
ncbi:uncharacterized protein RCO7_08382 [Rhynchosporium graminicola]|uniref:Uncharacterized protein n=1 Tax=Rhynchosporium graminicola TaxID=2792576 RepID=A0A1E1KQ92_9HELO|nr:uncharacterized protein RCO7_08382 [Rhynchosporium commune]